jgi:hypothetical protein
LSVILSSVLWSETATAEERKKEGKKDRKIKKEISAHSMHKNRILVLEFCLLECNAIYGQYGRIAASAF